jgi:plasmid stabilization system protein ParE
MISLAVTRSAKADISQILDYLEREAGALTADRYSWHFRDTLSRLAAFPESGSLRSVLGPFTRIAVIRPYVVIYDFDVSLDTVTVLRVLHGKRSITKKLLRRS